MVIPQGQQNTAKEYKWKSNNDITLKVVNDWGESLQGYTQNGPYWYLGLNIYEVDTKFSKAANEHFQEKIYDIICEYENRYKSSKFNIESLWRYFSTKFKIHDFKKERDGYHKRDYGTFGLYLSL